MKKLLTSLASLIMVIALAFCVTAGCNGKNVDDSKKSAATASVKDVYAASALSGASYLSGAIKTGSGSKTIAQTTVFASFTDLASGSSERPSEFTREKAIELKNGLLAFEDAISKNISETVMLNDETGEYSVYEFVMTMYAGDSIIAKMYYNETPVTENEGENELDDDEEEKEVGEFESSTRLNGVIVYDDKVYIVTGEKELETDGKEREYSIEIITMLDKNNYVEFCYEVENETDENSETYEFKIVRDGVTVQETELEFESENGKTEISLKFKKGNNKDAGEFKIVKDDVNANVYRVRYELGNKKSYITVVKTENGYKFTYSNQFVEEIGFTDDLTFTAETV